MAFTQGVAQTVYITTFDGADPVAPTNPIVTVSLDGGTTFETPDNTALTTAYGISLELSAAETSRAAVLLRVTADNADTQVVPFYFEDAYTATRAGYLDAPISSRLAASWASGITALKNWLAILCGKAADESTLAEINATTAGATYDNTTDSTEAIRDSIAALGAGTGAAAITLIVKKDGIVTQGVPVTLQASGGVNVQVSDENGEVVFNRDDGSWAYVIADSAAYMGASGTVVVASGAVTEPAGGVLNVTAISLPVPTSPDCYLLYAQERKADNGDAAFGAGEVTVKVLRIEFPARLDSAASSVRTVVGKEYQTDANGVWSFELAKSAFSSGALLVLERSWEDADGNPDSEIWQVTLDDAAATVDDQICIADLSIRRGQ